MAYFLYGNVLQACCKLVEIDPTHESSALIPNLAGLDCTVLHDVSYRKVTFIYSHLEDAREFLQNALAVSVKWT